MIDHGLRVRRALNTAKAADGIGSVWTLLDEFIQDNADDLVFHLASCPVQRGRLKALQLAARRVASLRRSQRSKGGQDAS